MKSEETTHWTEQYYSELEEIEKKESELRLSVNSVICTSGSHSMPKMPRKNISQLKEMEYQSTLKLLNTDFTIPKYSHTYFKRKGTEIVSKTSGQDAQNDFRRPSSFQNRRYLPRNSDTKVKKEKKIVKSYQFMRDFDELCERHGQKSRANTSKKTQSSRNDVLESTGEATYHVIPVSNKHGDGN